MRSITVIKSTSASISIPGYNFFILNRLISIVTITLLKKLDKKGLFVSIKKLC